MLPLTETGSFHIGAGDAGFYTKGVLDLHKARVELKNVADSTWKDFGSVEAMARVVELAAALSGDNAGLFMDLTIPVLSGEAGIGLVWNGWIPQQSGQGPEASLYYADMLRTNGFAPMYADPDVTDNQVHHVWYEAQLAYYYSHDFAFIANVWHETFDWTTGFGGKSLQDIYAGVAGHRIGAGLRSGRLHPGQVADQIRRLETPDTRRCYARNRCGARY